ncbi:hypothetical protein QWM81_01435 [Streptomyces ficellus]|uniref:Uncharacterized protein n=1 Tax=Streptomyces ficellus TaxID=1977088 RepID=A0ABT7YZR1_9ACTN|nr:hypothetical protein [Streptomyces ficellus]MDN3292727.1 hypothetical protein [Streptomyces ficellus]
MVRRRVPPLAVALVLGGLWWWAVLRLALAPGQAGLVEGTVAAGGWGLSLLPVHVTSARRRRVRRTGPASPMGPTGPPGPTSPPGPASPAGRTSAW